MQISTNGSGTSFELIFKFDNTTVTEDVKIGHYEKLPNGRNDYSKGVKYDISTDVLNEFANALTEMLNDRVEHYDAPELIRALVSKLSPSQFKQLVEEDVLAEDVE